MTIWDTLQSMVHRWYISLVAIVMAVAISHSVLSASGVYWSRAEVTLLVPKTAVNQNTVRPTSEDLVMTAAIVAKLVNGTTVRHKMADPAATIVGEGVVDGWAVRLPDYGGQWSRMYSRQVLDVQVSGPTAEAVSVRHQALLARIEAELTTIQQDLPQAERITTITVPEEPQIRHLSGQPIRALAMVWLLCGAAAFTTSGLVESLVRRHRAKRA